MMHSSWLRAVRARFLAASIIGVGVGLAVSWLQGDVIRALDAVLTLAGVLALHASVDLLNDYWDHRRGIDSKTTRTPFSGGTGVLYDGSLSPHAVRTAGIAMLVTGLGIGTYFAVTHGPVIALILGFAGASVYFYSTRIVDSGLAEVFVATKGALIVLGTSYIQSGYLSEIAVGAGACIGLLSALVLFVTSFPDHDADKQGGRRTLVVVAGRKTASSIYWVFVGVFGATVIALVLSGILPALCALCLGALPLALSTGRILRKYDGVNEIIPAMRNAVLFGRISGVLLLAGLVVSAIGTNA